MKKLITVPLILLLFAFPSITQAQYEDDYDEGNLMLGPRIGYYEADDAEEGAFLFGLQLRGHVNEYFGLELAATYRTTSEFEYTIAGQTHSVKTGFVPITASALVYLPLNEHFLPYGVAGVGGYYTFRDTEGSISDEFEGEFNFGYHLGFGLEVPLNEDVAINADYRYLWLTPEEDQNDFSGHMITFGLMFYL